MTSDAIGVTNSDASSSPQVGSMLDVLIPTYRRPAALAVTLMGLLAQTVAPFRIVVSDQTEPGHPGGDDVADEVRAVLRVLEARGFTVELHRHLPRRGLAEQRQFLLDQAVAPYALFCDDDVICEPDLLERLLAAIRTHGCGFVGSAVQGLSYIDDERPHQQDIELWEGAVQPEQVGPGMPQWDRYLLHNAANLTHVARRLGLTSESSRLYKVAWASGCVLFDTAMLRAVGGYDFWARLPLNHSGEDVLAQMRVMARFGGAGIIPSGAYHQELPTTLPLREVDAPHVLSGTSVGS